MLIINEKGVNTTISIPRLNGTIDVEREYEERNYDTNGEYILDRYKLDIDVKLILNSPRFISFTGDLNITTADLSMYDFSRVVQLYYFFTGCKNLKSVYLGKANLISLNYANEAFRDCESLEIVDFSKCYNVNNLCDIDSMFYMCKSLKSLDLSNFNAEVRYAQDFIYGCYKLETLKLGAFDFSELSDKLWFGVTVRKLTNLDMSRCTLPKKDLNIGLDKCINLTAESLVTVLTALPNTTQQFTLTLGDINLEKLTEEQKLIAINKGWILN